MPIGFFFACLLFSVFGFFSAVRMLTDWIFASEQVCVAIEIMEKKDADMLDMLLHEAQSAFFKNSAIAPVVLISTDLMNGIMGEGEELYEQYSALLDRFGAKCYLIEP